MRNQQKLYHVCFYSSCMIFFFVILIYDFSSSNSDFLDQLSNENISLEQALEKTPICTPFDRFRQRALLQSLQAWHHFAKEHHIRYWIGYGTLVGYVQRGGILPHDLDIDILIMAQDTSQLFELAQLNFSSIYKLKVHPQWYIAGYANRSYFLF